MNENMSYKLAWEAHGVVLHFSGQITIRDILNASVEYQKDRKFDDLLYVIADYSHIKACDAKPTEMDDLWAIDVGAKLSNGNIRKAIISSSPEVIALAKHYSKAPDPVFPVRIFATEADARAWLLTPAEV
jgi:hypothetical protein